MTVTGAQIVAEVEKFTGDPYVYGAAGPTSFDCSGLVQYVLTQLGISNVPRTSEEQYAWATKISANQLAPGDLIFAQFPGDNASPGHVGIYVGNGMVLSAQDPSLGVGLASLSSWGNNIVGYGQVPDTSEEAGQGSGGVGSIITWPSEITGFFSEANSFVTKLMWLANPQSWMRIGAFLVGLALLLFAIHAFIAVSNNQPIISMPSVVPVPV